MASSHILERRCSCTVLPHSTIWSCSLKELIKRFKLTNVVCLTKISSSITTIDHRTTTRTDITSSSIQTSRITTTVVCILTLSTKAKLQWSLVLQSHRYAFTVVSRATWNATVSSLKMNSLVQLDSLCEAMDETLEAEVVVGLTTTTTQPPLTKLCV
jgi:hypothetical protein